MPMSLRMAWVLLAACVALAFSRIGGIEFHPIDDSTYILGNPHVLGGLTWDGAAWALTSLQGGMWMPSTWLSLMANVDLFGVRAAGFHAVNLGFHVANAFLVYLLLRTMTGMPWRAFAVAGLFAVHPQHAEVVVWAVERKEVLAAFFGLATLLCYRRYVAGQGGRLAYGAALLSYLLSMGSKPMWVSLPLLLILVDFWPLDRFGRTPIRRLIVEKLPFALMAGCIALATLVGSASGVAAALGGSPADHRAGLGERIVAVPLHYLQYLHESFWPVELSTFHPIFPGVADPLASLGATLLLLGITLAGWWLRKREPAFLIGWVWFLVALFPVSGIAQTGDQSVADRFTYLPHIGLFVAIVWPAANGLAAIRMRQVGGFALAGVLLLCALLTWLQTAYWRDGFAFWQHALRYYPGHPMLEFRLGHLLAEERGRPEEAIPHLQRAVEAAPTNVVFVAYYGIALLEAGEREEASYFIEAALLNGRGSLAFDYLEEIGDLLLARGEIEQAGRFYERRLAVAPDSADAPDRRAGATLNLGLIRLRQGRAEDAERLFKTLPAGAPDWVRNLCAGKDPSLSLVQARFADEWSLAKRALCE